jgi:N-acetyl-anhydromuramyl-L-alanine amidase AmpD
MLEVLDYKIRETIKNTDKYERIVLCHTSRKIDEYLVSLKHRHNRTYNKIPHFVIKRDGVILNTLSLDQNSKMVIDEPINETSIFVSLENLGWLEKKPLEKEYLNWVGNIYKGDVFSKSWRDYGYWQPYTEEQIIKLAELCKDLANKFGISKSSIGTNTKIKGAVLFDGIISRSNMYEFLTDVSPAFDFEKFTKLLEDE